MELINQILGFSKAYPLWSLVVTLVFLFVYSVILLRKRRAIKTLIDIDIEDAGKLVSMEEKVNARVSYYYRVNASEKTLNTVRNASKIIDSYNHLLFAGFLWAIPVYFLWLPLAIITLPITLALACVYPDKLKNVLAKSVDKSQLSS